MELEVEEMEQELEREKATLYIQYLSQIFSQPLQEKPSNDFIKAKKEFEQLLTPDSVKDQNKVNYQWDFDPSNYYIEQ